MSESQNEKEFVNPLPSIEEQEQFQAYSPEEVYQNLLDLLEKEKSEHGEYTYKLNEILDAFEKFLTEEPAPPKEWMDRFGDRYEKFDYHQIVIPDDFNDPAETELTNLARLREEFGNNSNQALEHFLILRNHFIFTNGHAASIEAPKPLLMLESEQKDEEISWDCTYTLFADSSYQSYNLEKEEEESLGAYGEEVARLYPSVLRKLILRLPLEGQDFGHINPIGQCN
jgi:hypothetical protein